ncbi:neprilysin-2 isoform X2 [Bacillus rossius redtenbacheri]|uniref:neprilysin-2 isoform X2 n=1 Tax=Bacillus rossius redtenbacheri TaxID=93214 RepID=UPI002FDCAE3B
MKETVIKNPRWWHRRTIMERYLTVVAAASMALLVTVAVVLAILVAQQQQADSLPPMTAAVADNKTVSCSSAQRQEVCLTPGCVHAASSVLESLDTDVHPCDDFYQFACGRYVREKIIPDDKSSMNRFIVINDRLQEQLRLIIEEPAQPGELRPFRLVKQLYKACMNKSLIEDLGLQPMRSLLDQMGGWPVISDQWDPAQFSWLGSVYQFRKLGYSVDFFMDFSVATDAKNSTYRAINLDQASLGLSREYLVKGREDPIVEAYRQYQVDVAVAFGGDRQRAERELGESLDFEIQLANISLPSEKRRNITQLYNAMDVETLQKKHPSIPWLEYINTLLPPGVKVDNQEKVVVAVPSFLKSLEALLSNTPKRTLANYVVTRAVLSSVSYLTEDLRSKQLKFASALTGKTERESRWKECVDIVSGGISLPVGSLYVRKYFKEEAKTAALEMVQDIRNEFVKILKAVDWMDEDTRMKGLEKAASMMVHIAYPDELLDDKKLDDFYDGLELQPQLYLGSILNLTKFGTSYSFGRLRQKVNKTEWITHGRPAIVNAFYSSIENSIQFPAGILQGHFFGYERPRYMNYGAIGFVIGHEITHGFDDQGRQFDKLGNLVDWWDPGTKQKYLQKARCIIEQYGNYTEDTTGLKLNGINTQGENIADNGGIKEAYRAYLAWTERNGEEGRLPGLDFSPRQMFWISAAQSWCSKYRPEAMRQRITTGVHSPGRFRVLGPCSNVEEFSRDFACPAGSPMNPVSKCSVW